MQATQDFDANVTQVQEANGMQQEQVLMRDDPIADEIQQEHVVPVCGDAPLVYMIQQQQEHAEQVQGRIAACTKRNISDEEYVIHDLLTIFPRCITHIIGDMIYSCTKCLERGVRQECVSCGAHGHKSCVDLEWDIVRDSGGGYSAFWRCRECYAGQKGPIPTTTAYC
jgi:hypothetical protein